MYKIRVIDSKEFEKMYNKLLLSTNNILKLYGTTKLENYNMLEH